MHCKKIRRLNWHVLICFQNGYLLYSEMISEIRTKFFFTIDDLFKIVRFRRKMIANKKLNNRHKYFSRSIKDSSNSYTLLFCFNSFWHTLIFFVRAHCLLLISFRIDLCCLKISLLLLFYIIINY